MKSTKNSIVAIKELIADGGAIGVSIGETYTFHVGDASELAEMGFVDTKECTLIAVNIAIRGWSLADLNEEFIAAGNMCHTDLDEARKAMTKLLLEDFVDETNTVEQYKYATDSEHGFLHARSFEEAKAMLCELVTDETLRHGATGWVEDSNGNRFERKFCD